MVNLYQKTAKTPFEQREIRDILNKEYKKDKKRLEPDELRLINKHPEQIKAQVEALSVIPDEIIEPTRKPIPTPRVDIYDMIIKRTQMKPGLSEDLMKLQSDINKNIKYVLGSANQKDESKERRIEIPTQEKEEINND